MGAKVWPAGKIYIGARKALEKLGRNCGVKIEIELAEKEGVVATNGEVGVISEKKKKRKHKKKSQDNLNYQEARATLLQCVRLAYLRDCRSWPKYHIAKIDASGSTIEGPLMIDSNWEYAKDVKGYE